MDAVLNDRPIAWDGQLADDIDEVRIDVANDVAGAADRIVAAVQEHGFAILVNLTAGDPREGLLELASVVGRPIAQSPRGELVESVRDFSPEEGDDGRGYRSGGPVSLHTDPPKLLVLHCLQPAKAGGESYLVSARSVHDSVAAEDPALLATLYQPFPQWQLAGRGGRATAGPAEVGVPVFATADDGTLSCLYYRPVIEKGAAGGDEPLTDAQVAALDAFDRAANDRTKALRHTLAPGETLLLHNRFVLHARTDFEDWSEPERRRHLLRCWVDSSDRFRVAEIHEQGTIFPLATPQ